jgi:hypothetical protein
MPKEAAEKLLHKFQEKDPEIMRIFKEHKITSITIPEKEKNNE